MAERPEVQWRLTLVGWVIGLGALVLLLLSLTGHGTGPNGFTPLSNGLWVWFFILVFMLAWIALLRGLPWPSPMRRARQRTR